MQQAAAPDDQEAFEYLCGAVLSVLDCYVHAVVESYEIERAALLSEKGGGSDLVARMLLTGQDARSDAVRFGIEIARSYDVLALAIDMQPDELVTDPTGRQVAGRRKLREILRLPDFHHPVPILAMLEPSGGHLLIPASESTSSYESVCALVARIQSAANVSVTAGLVESVAPADVQQSGILASEILSLAKHSRGRPSVSRLADVALAYQLTRPSAGTRHLTHVLEKLDPHPELIEILDCYLHHDLDRGRTARALRIHPNTVNNRLHRVAALIGIDPSKFEGIMLLGSALALRRWNGDG